MEPGRGHHPRPVEGRVVPAVADGRPRLSQPPGPARLVERAEGPAGQVELGLEVVLGARRADVH
jgi:hypothetical protein